MQSPQVLIVGAGLAGLTAGLTLLKNGVPVRIIEKEFRHHQRFRGSGVQPRTEEFEYFLGVLDDVKKYAFDDPIGYKYDSLDPYKLIGSMKMVQDFDPTPAYPFTKPFKIAQYQHEAVLRQQIERLGANVELGTWATAVEQDESSVMVDIVKEYGGTEVKEKAKFAFVIGCDGGHSLIRKELGIKFVGETHVTDTEKKYIADVRIEGFTRTGAHFWGKPFVSNAAFLRYAGEPGRYQILMGGPSVDYELLSTNKDGPTLQNEFKKVTKRDDVEVREVFWQGEWRLNVHMAEKFSVGRVFIAGDAAHTHSPAGGQGLNAGIADAFNLSWKLSLVLKGQAPTTLLDSYDLERIPIISEMLQISTSLHNKVPERSFSEVQGQEQADALLRDWRLFQLDLNYRHSPLVLDDRFVCNAEDKTDVYGKKGHDTRGGDRAPDAPGLSTLSAATEMKPTRIFELFNPASHTVLIFSSALKEDETRSFVQSVLRVLERLAPGLIRTGLIIRGDAEDAQTPFSEADFALKDGEGHAFKNYGIADGQSAIVIVRPDTYIGAFANDLTGVEKYLSLIFGPSA